MIILGLDQYLLTIACIDLICIDPVMAQYDDSYTRNGNALDAILIH